MTQAVRHDSMRARNLGVVLGEVSRTGPLTRAALAEITGLTKTTVSKLVADLLEAGIVVESGAVRDGERGRPGVAIRLSGHRVAALGLEINVDYLAVCVVDLTRSVRLRRTRSVDNRGTRPAGVLADLRELAVSAVQEATGQGLRVAGTVLAVPGPVDGGLLHYAPNLGWRDVRVQDLLELGATVDNEANLAALGELWFGSGAADFLYVSGEIGIGAGLVVDGKVFRGTYGVAGELGHVIVSPDGPACRCGGRGCLEVYAGQDALLRAAGLTPREGTAVLLARLAAGDARALAACEQAGRALGLALTAAVHLLDPGSIVLGGIFAPLFPWIAEPVSATLTDRLGQLHRSSPPLALSTIGADAAILGAAGQVIQRVLTDPWRYLSL